MILYKKIQLLFRAIFLSLILIFGYSASAQDQNVKLTNADEKKIAKADKESQKADELNKEADKIYSEIATKQSELTAEETEKLNNKALEKQIEALKIQQEANKTKYAIYESKANEFWKKFKGNPDEMGYAKSLENNARLNFQAADIQYKDALGTKDKLIAFTKMTSSSDMYVKALNDMKQAFDGYSGHSYNPNPNVLSTNPALNNDSASTRKDTIAISPKFTATDSIKTLPSKADTTQNVISEPILEISQPSIPPDTITHTAQNNTEVPISTPEVKVPSVNPAATNIYQAVKINELMIDRFNKFLQDNYPENYEKYVIDFASINYSDIESVRKAWYQRLYGDKYYLAMGEEPPVQKLQDQAGFVNADSINADSIKADNNMRQNNQLAENNNESKGAKLNSKSKKKKDISQSYGFGGDNSSNSYSAAGFSDTAMAKGFTYRVQVLACRVPVKADELKRAYPGDIHVTESFEDNWYKYTIGPYNSFSVARDFRLGCGVEGAFVAAYLNGKRINSTGALVKQEVVSQNFSNFSIQGNYVFKIQIAASRNELSDDVLRKIYVNIDALEKHFEDNWYKYTIDCGSDYGKACELIKNIEVPGAFIAVYHNNVRLVK